MTTGRLTLAGAVESELIVTNELNVAFYPMAEAGTTNCVLAIGANRVLLSVADIRPSAIEDTVMRKVGAGTLLRTKQVSTNASNPPYAGVWLIEEGLLDVRGEVGVIRGHLIVGGTDKTAKVFAGENTLSNTSMDVLENGEFDVGNMASGRCNPIHIYTGATMSIRDGKSFVTAAFNLYGATVDGAGQISSSNTGSKYIESHPSDVMSILNVPFVGNGWAMKLRAGRGTVPVDLLLNKTMREGDKSQSMVVSGGGVIKSVASNADLKYKMILGNTDMKSSVTCYLDGTTGAGGRSCVYIHYDSTLAGVGTFGNCTCTTNLAISVNGDDKTPTRCTIAPGTIDTETGGHIYGTMTVGDASNTRHVLFTNKGRLLFHLGEGRQCDRFVVNGEVRVEGTGNTVEVVGPEDLKRARTGKYTLLEARDGIVDAEGNAVAEPFAFTCANKKVTFGVEKNTEDKIVKIYANVPPQGLTVTVR